MWTINCKGNITKILFQNISTYKKGKIFVNLSWKYRRHLGFYSKYSQYFVLIFIPLIKWHLEWERNAIQILFTFFHIYYYLPLTPFHMYSMVQWYIYINLIYIYMVIDCCVDGSSSPVFCLHSIKYLNIIWSVAHICWWHFSYSIRSQY